MLVTRETSCIRYAVRIEDIPTGRKCKVYVSTDWDLEFLLFFLKSVRGLECDVKDLKIEKPDP